MTSIEHLSKRIFDLAKMAARADGTAERDLDAAVETYIPEARRFLAMHNMLERQTMLRRLKGFFDR